MGTGEEGTGRGWGGPQRPSGEGAPPVDAGGQRGGGGWGGAGRRRGRRRVPLAGAITYLLRSGWGERGTQRGGMGGTVVAFHPRLENPRGNCPGGQRARPLPHGSSQRCKSGGAAGRVGRGSPPSCCKAFPGRGRGGSGAALRRKAEVPASPLRSLSGFTPPGKAPLHALFRIYAAGQSPAAPWHPCPRAGLPVPAAPVVVPRSPAAVWLPASGGDRAGEGVTKLLVPPGCAAAPGTHPASAEHPHQPAPASRC